MLYEPIAIGFESHTEGAEHAEIIILPVTQRSQRPLREKFSNKCSTDQRVVELKH
jgi:hypothetical protein